VLGCLARRNPDAATQLMTRRQVGPSAGTSNSGRTSSLIAGGLRGGDTRSLGAVEQRISLVTLGVTDLARARRFYEELGWRGQEVEDTVFFQAGGQALVLWGRDELAADSGVDDDGSCSFSGITLAHNVRSPEEVEDIVKRAAGAGATVTRGPGETFYGGYAGCFRDPDGHVWEIAHNPGFALDAAGNLTVPDFGDRD
jgi:uncharacterized protein